MQRTIPFYRKFIICFTAGLVCSLTILRIITRLAYEAGVDTYRIPVPVIAAAPALVIFLIGLVYPFIWQKRAPSGEAKLVFWSNLLCYGIAIDLVMFGLQKWFGLQAHLHIALLDGPLSGFSDADLTWAYFNRAPAFFNLIGGLQIAGSLLLVFPRTKLLGLFTLLPVVLNICLTNYFYHFSPGELAHALVLLLGLLYLLLEEYNWLLLFFFHSGPLARGSLQPSPLMPQAPVLHTLSPSLPPPPQLPANSPSSLTPPGIPATNPSSASRLLNTLGRLSVIYIPFLLIICFFHLPEKDPAHGKYKVNAYVGNNHPVHLNSCADSILTQVYLDEGHDCLFEYNSRERWVIGNYNRDAKTHNMRVIWHYPTRVHDTLVAEMTAIPGGFSLDGRMGQTPIKMDWQKVW